MDRSLFHQSLADSLKAARDFGQEFVEETLPKAIHCRVWLNQSMDANLRPSEIVFPDDRSRPMPLESTEDQVMDLLWRDGRIPEWIDLSVVGMQPGVTIVELSVCGRFTSDERLLYHQEGGRPPFHVTSPPLPAGFRDGDRLGIKNIERRCKLREVHLKRASRRSWLHVLARRFGIHV